MAMSAGFDFQDKMTVFGFPLASVIGLNEVAYEVLQ